MVMVLYGIILYIVSNESLQCPLCSYLHHQYQAPNLAIISLELADK